MVQELKPGLPHLKHVITWGEESPLGALSLKDLLSNPIEKKYPSDYLETKKIRPLDISTICLTTGTTGLPKFVEWPTCCFVITGLLIKHLNLTGDDIMGSMTGAVLGPNVVAFYRTGDLGKLDDEGNLILVGREKDMIIRGGQNIYPIEVVNLLLTHPKVADAAIVGIPDSILGEKCCACIVTQQGQAITLEDIINFLRSKRIVLYKLPEKLLLMKKLPYVGGMKLDKKALQAQAIEELKTRGEIR